MFSEILKIIPRVDDAALNQMMTKLNSRFGSVAKKFGKGLANIFKGGGVAGGVLGAATVLFDKLLNPLKEVQESIDRTLTNADDVATFAKQFGSNSGKLLRLQALAQAQGLDKDSLYMLINKFQTSVAEAEKDKTKDTSVRGFVGQSDMVDAFFLFIQNLQKMNKNQQLLVQQEVFGEKQILKMADFLGSDFPTLIKQLGGPSSQRLTKSNDRLADLNDLQDLLAANRGLQDVMNKGSIITADMIKARDQNEKLLLERENTQIKGFMAMITLAETSNTIMKTVDEIWTFIGTTMIPEFRMFFTTIKEFIKDFKNSRLFKGFFGGN